MAYRYQQSPLRGAQPGDVLVVIHDFDARSGDELTLRRGDRIELVELDDGFGDGWYLGKHLGRDSNGLFPGVYTAIVAGAPTRINATSPGSASHVHAQPAVSLDNGTASALNGLARGSQDDTPQASRHTSVTTSSPPMNAGAQPEASRTNSVKAAPVSLPNIQRSINETLGAVHKGEDSPVMNETLSVIDEHITNLSTPRHSVVLRDKHMNDSASEYSSHHDNRLSYIAGPDTDDEAEDKLEEEAVRQWDHKQTAQHLRSLGMDPHHCNIFEEQEISGDVLLDMDQSFVYMKEYDFGVMGKRLKTWHKIRDFQREVKGLAGGSINDDLSEDADRSQSRLGQTSGFLPRIPSLIEKPGPGYRQSRQQTPPNMYSSMSMGKPAESPLGSQSVRASAIASASDRQSIRDGSGRPSMGSIRQVNHAHRRSLVDAIASTAAEHHARAGVASGKPSAGHQKQASFDRNWSMSSAVPTLNTLGTPPIHSLAQALHQEMNSSDPNLNTSSTTGSDLDRGYFSGGEVDSRKARNVLRKRESSGTAHSRHSSLIDDPKRSAAVALKRHSRFGSADSIRDLVPMVTSTASKAYHASSYKGRFRSASAKSAASAPFGRTVSPTVTNLEDQDSTSPGSLITSPKPDSGRSSPLPMAPPKSSATKSRRIVGLRAISDAVTGHEKALVSSPTAVPTPIKEDHITSPTRTGSSTPSAASKSIDNDTTDVSSKGTEAPPMVLPPKVPVRGKTKSKKETSAYMRGLQKLTPAEQRLVCDHSGWMKKKSSSLITTWKPRLFILRGRRLSYYYSEEDTEERGVIDISSHKVLVADQDPITTLHATITGSTSSPVSPQSAQDPALATEKPITAKFKADTDGPFFFKLVPPKTGLSRAVQFTKPTVHYFQIDTVAEGRRWMGELLKATIDHHPELGFETTNKQKTISLAKARARKERPPALMGDDKNEVPDGPKSDETGLNIRGLSFDEGDETLSNGQGHGQQSSLEAIGAYLAQNASDTGQSATA